MMICTHNNTNTAITNATTDSKLIDEYFCSTHGYSTWWAARTEFFKCKLIPSQFCTILCRNLPEILA